MYDASKTCHFFWQQFNFTFKSTRSKVTIWFNYSFIGISGSILATSYVKWIDVWMIFTMVVPFLEASIFYEYAVTYICLRSKWGAKTFMKTCCRLHGNEWYYISIRNDPIFSQSFIAISILPTSAHRQTPIHFHGQFHKSAKLPKVHQLMIFVLLLGCFSRSPPPHWVTAEGGGDQAERR